MKLSSKTYILRFNTNRGKLWQQPQWHQQGSKQSLLRLDTLALKESKFDRRNTQNQNQNSSTGIWLINQVLGHEGSGVSYRCLDDMKEKWRWFSSINEHTTKVQPILFCFSQVPRDHFGFAARGWRGIDCCSYTMGKNVVQDTEKIDSFFFDAVFTFYKKCGFLNNILTESVPLHPWLYSQERKGSSLSYR